jgi:hypothetical protein
MRSLAKKISRGYVLAKNRLESGVEIPIHHKRKVHSMILGYPQQTTVSPGGLLTLHVSTDAPAFRVDFTRHEDVPVSLFSSDWLPGQLAPMPADGGTDCAWPEFRPGSKRAHFG